MTIGAVVCCPAGFPWATEVRWRGAGKGGTVFARISSPPLFRLGTFLIPLLLLGGLAAAPAEAAVVRALGLRELVARAEVIGVAAVESATSFWVSGRIVTDSILRLDLPLRGAAVGDRVVVRTLGGEVDRIGQRVFGEPIFRPGERYLVFLERLPGSSVPALLRPVGMAQGVLPVVDAPGGPLVTPPPDLPLLVDPGAMVSPAPWLTVPRPLDVVLGELRAALAEAAL